MEDLEKKYDELMNQLIDLKFKQKHNKEVELIEFLRDLYNSLDETRLEDFSKREILINLRDYIDEFVKNNNIRL